MHFVVDAGGFHVESSMQSGGGWKLLFLHLLKIASYFPRIVRL